MEQLLNIFRVLMIVFMSVILGGTSITTILMLIEAWKDFKEDYLDK